MKARKGLALAKIISSITGDAALTFDDVLLQPARSDVLPTDVDIRSRVTKDIALNLPILSSAMDTVTEGNMAIAMAQAGGMGVIHRNLTPEQQAEQVKQVKHFESGMVVNPITIGPDATLADAYALMDRYRISGIPVVANGGTGGRNNGKLLGVLTNRDVRFANNDRQKISELMTHDGLVTVREGVSQDEAKRLLHQHRIEKLLVVDEYQNCIGLITVKDMEKAQLHPSAIKDEQGRLRVAAASTTGDLGLVRSMLLIDAGVDLVAHSGQTMTEVVSAIERVSALMGEIAASSQQQASGIAEVKSAVNQMDEVTQQNALLVEEAAAASEALRDRSTFLDQAASVFMVQKRPSRHG